MARRTRSADFHRRRRRRIVARSLAVQPLESRKVLSAAGALPGPLQDVVVVLHEDVADPRATAQELAGSDHGGSLSHIYQHALKGFSAQVYSAKAIAHSPLVQYVEPNGVMQTAAQSLPTGIERIGTDENAVANIDGLDDSVDVDIAIIDTGIDRDHPDLNVVDGVRFYGDGGPPWNPKLGEDDQYDDDHGHGTHVAGTAAALDNDQGVVGVAPGARLWAVKVLDSRGSGSVSQVIAGMDWVAERAAEIEVANMSLGGGYSQSINDALEGMTEKGVVVAVAAGNDGADAGNYSPASAETAITVSAAVDTDGQAGGKGPSTDYGDDDTLADFSNDGDVIDLAAPGVDIESTYPGGYATFSGTSMASPHVAGAAALEIAGGGRDRNDSSSFDGEDVAAITDALIAAGEPMEQWRGDSADTDSDEDGDHEPMVYVGGPVDAPPEVEITEPGDGTVLAGEVDVTAEASDDKGVEQVEFFAGDVSLGNGVESTDGWSVSWDTTSVDDGSHGLTAVATDTAGQTTSHSVSVEVDNVDDPPEVQITDPAADATVSGEVQVIADADDDDGVDRVEFFVGGESLGVDTDPTDGWSAVWDTDTELVPDGAYTLTATATDTAGQSTSHSVSVEVNNSVTLVHVADLNGTVETNKNRWEATAHVLVVDASGNPVQDAEVTMAWESSGGSSGTDSALTDSSGWAAIPSGWLHKKEESVTFTVTGVTKQQEATYDPTANEDPDGDSDGTSIVISKDGTTSAPASSSVEATDAVMAGALDELLRRV